MIGSASTMTSTVHRIPAVQEVPGAAFGAYWGSRYGASDPFTVRLVRDGACLGIDTVDGQPVNDWLADLPGSLAHLRGTPPDDCGRYAVLDEPAVSGQT